MFLKSLTSTYLLHSSFSLFRLLSIFPFRHLTKANRIFHGMKHIKLGSINGDSVSNSVSIPLRSSYYSPCDRVNPYAPLDLGLNIPDRLLSFLKTNVNWFFNDYIDGNAPDTVVIPYLVQVVKAIGSDGIKDLQALKCRCAEEREDFERQANNPEDWKLFGKKFTKEAARFWTRICTAINVEVRCDFRILPFQFTATEDKDRNELVLHVPVSTTDVHSEKKVLSIISDTKREKTIVCLMLVGGPIVIKHEVVLNLKSEMRELLFGREGKFLLDLL